MDRVTRDHMNALNSRVNQFRVDDAYWDVEIQVEESVFKCHRLILAAASEYFHIMFGGKFEESTAARVTLKDVETNTFQDVLRFIYTGQVSVNNANLYKLLRAGDFFKLPYLEESCVQYVQQNADRLIENGLEILSFTLAIGKTNISEVVGRYIYNNFDYFSKIPEFLEISFEDFVTILNFISSSASTFQDVFMYAIMRWTRHTDRSTKVRRTQHFDELFKRINFSKLSSDCVEHLVRMNSKDFTALSAGYDQTNDETADRPQVLAINSEVVEQVVDSKRLHVYVNAYSEDESQFFTNVFTLYHQSGNQQRWIHSYQYDRDNSFEFMRTTVLDDRLYCLSFSNDKLPAGSGQQTFKMSSSASLCSNSYLKPPPFIWKRYDMYGFDKHIYVCNTSASSDIVVRQPANSSLCEEQLSRGIYRYNREIDTWESLPRTSYQNFENACMTGLEQTIYLIGGTIPNQFLIYDSRCPRWICRRVNHNFGKAACCSHQGKIYVSGGNHHPHQTIMLDPLSLEWHSMEEMNQGRSNHHIEPYLHSKGILVTAGEELSRRSDLEFYDSSEKKWKYMSSLYKSVQDSDVEFKKNLKVIDMVNFKPDSIFKYIL